MRMDKYGRELDLILILTENASYTAQQIADRSASRAAISTIISTICAIVASICRRPAPHTVSTVRRRSSVVCTSRSRSPNTKLRIFAVASTPTTHATTPL